MTEHAKSLLPAGKQWKLVWHDEFDGNELDRTKWDFRLHLFQQRHKTWTDQGAFLDGKGNLHLKLIEKDGHYYSSQLQTGCNFMDRPGTIFYETENCPRKDQMCWPIAKIQEPKFMHKYGYYEIRCKLQTQDGWWSAFWLQSPIIGATLNPEESGVEVDIMECFDPRKGIVLHNNHWNGYGVDHQLVGSGERKLRKTPDDFHVFGLEWNEKEYVYYIDGEESWRVTGPISHREQFILISTECRGYRGGNQPIDLLRQATLPDAFIVDYVRVFDEVK